MLKHRFILAAENSSRRTLIVLHGLGDSLESYLDLPDQLQLPWLNYVFVNAPFPHFGGYVWFAFPGDPVSGAEVSYHHLQQLLAAQQANGFPPEQTVLFGFSQGGFMVWELGIRYSQRFAGCIGVSGFMRDPDALWQLRSPLARQQRFCMTHGILDDLLPIEQTRTQIGAMRAAGLQVVWQEIVKGHTLDPFGELLFLRRFMEQCFAGGTHGIVKSCPAKAPGWFWN